MHGISCQSLYNRKKWVWAAGFWCEVIICQYLMCPRVTGENQHKSYHYSKYFKHWIFVPPLADLVVRCGFILCFSDSSEKQSDPFNNLNCYIWVTGSSSYLNAQFDLLTKFRNASFEMTDHCNSCRQGPTIKSSSIFSVEKIPACHP